MDQDVLNPKKRERHLDRVVMDAQNFAKVDGLRNELHSLRQGIHITHNDLMNWSLRRAPVQLSSYDQEELKELYFDEIRFLKQLLCEVRRSRGVGEKIDLGVMMPMPPVKVKKRRRKVDVEMVKDEIKTNSK